MSRKRRPPPRPQGPLAGWTIQRAAVAGWTIQRAAVAGIGFGLIAFLLSNFAESRGTFYVYAGLLALTIACGASILLILLKDAHARQRGDRVRPIRIFDLTMGVLLVLPAGYGLVRIWPYLGL